MLLRESVVELGPGSVLAARYQIRRVLGKGATGVVLEADDRVSRSLVALKVFKPEIASDDRWQEIVGSELRHARQIMHPNVCRVFDAGEAGGYRFLSMEYASGGSLRQRLKEAGTDRPFEERIADARAVVQGLAAIHAAGLIHRDVKPDNVLRMEDGRLVLTDFGLAIAPGQATFVSGYSGAVGTPSYMAPEVAMGGDASMASDVFSLGVILHEIFFGRRPEWDTTRRGRFLRSPVDRSTQRRLRHMARLCAECLDELAPRRPNSAVEVSRRFERAAVGRSGTILGALRAGKWGLATGLVLAGVATSVVLMASRPGDGVMWPQVSGTPADWSPDATLIARRSGALRCLSASPDGKTVRVIWDAPPEAVEINVETGAAKPWNILPATYVGPACPVLSPDGRRLAFTAGEANSQIMLSPKPDGSGARALTTGSFPEWHPGGQELIYAFDNRRVGVVGDNGQFALFPEVADMEETLSAIAVNHAGDQLLTVHRGQRGSLLVIHDYPSLNPARKYRFDFLVSGALFSAEGKVYVTNAREGRDQVLELETDDRLVRRGRMGGSDIFHLAVSPPGLWLGTHHRRATLFARLPDGRRRDLARSRDFRRMSVAANGDVVVEENLRGVHSVIGLYTAADQRYRRLTTGPSHYQPVFEPKGNTFAFVDQSSDRIQVCEVASGLQCRSFAEGEGATWVAGFSPGGQQLAYTSVAGARVRLRVVSLPDRRVSDLGLTSRQRCAIRWTDESRLWAFRPEESQWTELDVSSRTPTGRTESVARLGADGCPEPDGSVLASPLGVVSEREALLWLRRR